MVPFQPPVQNAQPMPGVAPLLSPKVLQVIARIKKAIDLLKSDIPRGYRIDIETDSTVQGDAQMEKAQRIEFVEGVTKFIETAGQVVQVSPAFAPLAAKMLQFAVRGFRVGRDLESAIDEFCDQAEKQAKLTALKEQKANTPPADAPAAKPLTCKCGTPAVADEERLLEVLFWVLAWSSILICTVTMSPTLEARWSIKKARAPARQSELAPAGWV
jgi:hypothetical protein